MDEKDWPLTSRAIEESEQVAGDCDLTDDTEPVRGNRLLHLFAEHSDAVTQIGPGAFYARKDLS